MYENYVMFCGDSIMAGKREEKLLITDKIFKIPVMREWLQDDNLQGLTIVSINIGFVKTFQKVYKKENS